MVIAGHRQAKSYPDQDITSVHADVLFLCVVVLSVTWSLICVLLICYSRKYRFIKVWFEKLATPIRTQIRTNSWSCMNLKSCAKLHYIVLRMQLTASSRWTPQPWDTTSLVCSSLPRKFVSNSHKIKGNSELSTRSHKDGRKRSGLNF